METAAQRTKTTTFVSGLFRILYIAPLNVLELRFSTNAIPFSIILQICHFALCFLISEFSELEII